MSKEIKYPAARSHKFLHAAPQFRPIRRGARRKGIDREYVSKDGLKKMTIYLFYELDIADQDLLLCLIGMLLPESKGKIVNGGSTKKSSLELRRKLDLDGSQVLNMDALKAETTGYELLVELGRKTGKSDYQWLEKSMDRLALVQFKFDNNGDINYFKLLSFKFFKNNKGVLEHIEFCINPYSANAVLGSGGYVLQHRVERSVLKKEEERALHSVLCGLVDMGAERTFNVDMIADKVYSRYDDDITSKAKETRRKSIRNACAAIDDLDYWSCFASGVGVNAVMKVKRKRRKDIF